MTSLKGATKIDGKFEMIDAHRGTADSVSNLGAEAYATVGECDVFFKTGSVVADNTCEGISLDNE